MIQMKSIKHKKILAVILPLIAVIGIFVFGHSARADWAVTVVSGILGVFIAALGVIVTLVIHGLIFIAEYQNFINSDAVRIGWVIVRDICNMFFVVILLIIAFGTILHSENYNYKKWLPKLILMAVLINFSKTICGLLIDATQIVMLTFVNAFKDVGGANLTDILGLSNIVTMAKGSDATVSLWTVVGAYVLGIIYLLIATVVIATMMMMLVMRLVMIWIYVVLSPAAYLLATFPGGQKYSSRWWSEFVSNLIIGPVLAFFIWLSFAALQTYSAATGNINTKAAAEAAHVLDTTSSGNNALAGTNASTPASLIQFVIAIGMLLAGLKISQEIGGYAGDIAGKGMSKISKGASFAGGVATKGLKATASGDNYFARKFAKTTGWDFRPVKLKESFKATMEASRRKDESEIRRKAKSHFEAGGVRSLAMGMGAGEDYFNRYIDGFLGLKGIKRAVKDVVASPIQRSHLGQQMDRKSADITALQNQRANIIKEKQADIDSNVNAAVNGDAELASLRRKKFDNQMRINELNNKPHLSAGETSELEKLNKTKSEIEGNIAGRTMSLGSKAKEEFLKTDADVADIDVKIKANEDDLRKLKENITKVQKPVGLQSRSEYRKNIEEAKSKYKTITNADELLKALSDAKQRNDKFDQVAVLEKLSSDGNLNEELRDKGYASSAIGLYKYINNQANDFGEKKGLTGFSDSGRLQIMNDLGESEERVNHWDMAKMVGMNQKGELESLVKETKDKDGKPVYDDTEHATAAYAEVMKMDPQQAVIKLNRLAYGGEDGNGKFQIASLGKMIYKALAEGGAYEKNAGRVQTNAAANLTSDNIVPILQQILSDDKIKSDEVIKLLRQRGSSKDQLSFKAGDMAAWLKNSGI